MTGEVLEPELHVRQLPQVPVILLVNFGSLREAHARFFVLSIAGRKSIYQIQFAFHLLCLLMNHPINMPNGIILEILHIFIQNFFHQREGLVLFGLSLEDQRLESHRLCMKLIFESNTNNRNNQFLN